MYRSETSSRRSFRPELRQTAEPRPRQESSRTRLRRKYQWDFVAVLPRSDTLRGQLGVARLGPTLAVWKCQEPAGPLPGWILGVRLFACFFSLSFVAAGRVAGLGGTCFQVWDQLPELSMHRV